MIDYEVPVSITIRASLVKTVALLLGGGRYQKRNFRSQDTKSMDVTDFIFRLETLVNVYDYPVECLVRFVFEFVSGTAEKWLWVFVRGNPNADWHEIREALSSRFVSSDSQSSIKRKVENRLQRSRREFQ